MSLSSFMNFMSQDTTFFIFLMYWFLAKGFGSDKLYLKLLLAPLRALDLMQYFLARLSATLAKEMLPHLNFFHHR